VQTFAYPFTVTRPFFLAISKRRFFAVANDILSERLTATLPQPRLQDDPLVDLDAGEKRAIDGLVVLPL
jgi:hypothetical protein